MCRCPWQKARTCEYLGWLKKGTFIAPFTFTGGCNQDVFNAWLEHILLPELSPGTTLILDNAAFHKSAKTRILAEKTGCHILFLPTYSPDLNPIENCWHQIKATLRPLIQNGYENFQDLIGKIVSNI
ncbi:MAG: IS630 family transposase [Alphaproteobacteria bacterium]